MSSHMEKKMQLISLGEPYQQNVEKMLFLADLNLHQGEPNDSWQFEALQMLEMLGYDGVVYIPEYRCEHSNTEALNSEARIKWTHGALMRSDMVVFLLSGNLSSRQSVVIDIELGWLMKSGRIVLATLSETEAASDLHRYADELNVPCYPKLSDALDEAVKKIGACALRQNGEAAVPLDVWRTENFQEWLTAQKKNGNRLDDACIEWIGRVGPSRGIVFFWVIYVKVWIQDEGRYKENEWIIGRPDISSVLLYMPHSVDPLATKIVLVKEFRSPASNSQAKIYELPGGSTFESGVKPYTLAAQELQEETGFRLPNGRKLRSHISRQLSGTLSTHKGHLFSLELTAEEMSSIEENVGRTFGRAEDTEQTTLMVTSLGEILRTDYADYATIGMIVQALTDNGIIR